MDDLSPTLPAAPTRALHANQTSPPLRGRWKDCSDDIVYSTADLWTSMLPVYRWLLNTCVGQGGGAGKGEGKQSGLRARGQQGGETGLRGGGMTAGCCISTTYHELLKASCMTA